MTKFFLIITVGILLFVTITLYTATFEAASDGDNIVGFPFVFYKHHSWMCNPCPLLQTEFNFHYFYLICW